jgi:HK97 family phage major capsid protein
MTQEKLHEYRRRAAEIAARMKAITKQEDELAEGEALPEPVVSEFEQLKTEMAALEGRIMRLEEALAAEAATTDGDGEGGGEAAAAGGVTTRGGMMTRAGFRVAATPRRQPEPGKGFQVARYLIGLAHMRWNGRDKAVEFIENRFHDDMVTRALNVSVVAEGGALIPQDFLPDLIELLRARVVVRAAMPMSIGMPMGNMTIPRLAGGATAGYQGELDDIALSEEAFDDLDLAAKKLTAMVPVSNDLLRRAPIGVEGIVRDDLVQTVARREDIAFLRGDGTGKSPIGFRTLVLPAHLIVIPAGGNLDAVVAGLAAMKLALINGMSRMLRPTWYFAATVEEFIRTRRDQVGGFYYKDEMSRGTLDGYPFYSTQQIPTNLGAGNGSEIYLVDMADAVLADTMNVQVDASDQAAYYGTDAKVVSSYQRDQTLFRVISEHDFNMRHLQSLAVGTTTDWFFTGLPGVPGAPFSTQPLNRHWAQAPAAWPADATTPDPAPTLYDPATAMTSAFDGPLTDLPGGLPPAGSIVGAQGSEAHQAGRNRGEPDPRPRR